MKKIRRYETIMLIQVFANTTFIEALGWTLLHSLWQITLLASALALILKLAKNASASLRYFFCITAIVLTVAAFAVTFSVKFPAASTETATSQSAFGQGFAEDSAVIADRPRTNAERPMTAAEIIASEPLPPIVSASDGNYRRDFFEKSMIYIVGFWMLGVMFFAARFSGGIWHIHQLRTRRIEPLCEKWQAKFDELCRLAGIEKKVEIVQSRICEVPLVTGWFKPLIILPSSVLLGMKPNELELIIAHELIHIRRHDYLINILQSFVEIIFFFHPLIWWISAQARRERENVCDDEVLTLFGNESLSYAKALANLENFKTHSKMPIPANAPAASGGNLMVRIKRILKNKTEKKSVTAKFWSAVSAFLLISTFLATVFLVNLQTSNSQSSSKEMNNKKIAVGLLAASPVLLSENSPAEDLETMRLVAAKLKQHNIPATGFIAGGAVNISDESSLAKQQKNVEIWREAGFEVGILDYKYPKAFNATIDDYSKVLQKQKNDPLLDEVKRQFDLLKKSPQSPTNKEESEKQFAQYRDSVEKILENMQNSELKWQKENNLSKVRYTIGGNDWLYAYLYDLVRKQKDESTMRDIKAKYLKYMSEVIAYSEDFNQILHERPIPQVFSLAPSRLVADSADELFAMFKERGYQFVTMDDVLADENYPFNKEEYYRDRLSNERRIRFAEVKNSLKVPTVDTESLILWSKNQPKR